MAVELNGITWSSATKYLNARSELVRVIKDASAVLNIKAPRMKVAVFKEAIGLVVNNNNNASQHAANAAL